MRDRTELFESALDSLPAGIALFGMDGEWCSGTGGGVDNGYSGRKCWVVRRCPRR